MDTQQIFCAHCNQRVRPRTYREHRDLFYDVASRSWTKRAKPDSATQCVQEVYVPQETSQCSAGLAVSTAMDTVLQREGQRFIITINQCT